jgi:agmatine deiminase
MPAEWAPHRGTWLSWPHRESSWPGNFEPIPAVIAEMVRHLAPGEEVHINVADGVMERAARAVLAERGVPTGNVFFHHFPTNDAWCRDHGPIFVQRELPRGGREQVITDWGYNAWGGKYPPFDLDEQIPRRVADKFGITRVEPGMILEGGSIEVNGLGTLLTTEACLLNPNRNPALSRGDIEQRLRDNPGEPAAPGGDDRSGRPAVPDRHAADAATGDPRGTATAGLLRQFLYRQQGGVASRVRPGT